MSYIRIFAAIVIACGTFMSGSSQAPAGFEKFRKGIMKDYDSFKSRILEHYADFLAGEWHEYESLDAESKYSEPKPSAIPVTEFVTDEADSQNKEMLKSLGFVFGTRPMSEVAEAGDYIKWMRGVNSLYNAAPPAKGDGEGSAEVQTETVRSGGIVTTNGIAEEAKGDIFNFYGMSFAMPEKDFYIAPMVETTADYAIQWEALQNQGVADKLIPSIEKLQKVTGMSDYLLFEMLTAYLDSKFPDANDASKMSAVHYLLTNMGYGVRLAMDDNKNPFILIPFEEKIYGRSGLNLGRMYYVFSTPGRPHVKRMGLSSPYLPDNAEHGKAMKLRFDGLNLPYKPYHYAFEHENLKLEGEINENIIPMLYRYPQMDTGGFGASVISQDVRDEVVKQVKAQLGGMDPVKAADRLLAMIQCAFPYSVDDEFHGFEKPYFFEEILYYPKSDCEDRAVFYSYLLWHALGLESQMIAYPGHEAASLNAESVWGGNAHYYHDGKKFFISDPTYLGAPTGQCMTRFQNVEPVIDLSYPEPASKGAPKK